MSNPTSIDRGTAMRLAAAEYDRFLDQLRALRPEDWSKPTDCPGWDVRAIAAHLLGMVEMSASIREQGRQNKAAQARQKQRGGRYIDALTGLQVDERADMAPEQIVARLAARAPKAAKSRRRAPGFIRRRPLPVPQDVDGRKETWTLGYLIDVILTRDPWMHRVDIARATGAPLVLTADHDAVLVGEVVREWAERHGRPYELHLSGPAGGSWSQGTGGARLELDAVEFCRIVSGRGSGDGLLSTQVPF
jgi:uncharacterized protein (TIGR03083 family)